MSDYACAMRRMLTALLLCLLPGGVLGGPGMLAVESGVTGSYSAARVVSDHPHHTLVAEARVLTHSGHHAFVVEIGQTWDGVHPRLRLDRAHGTGIRGVEFDPALRREAFCTGAGRCDGTRVGALFFTQSAFEAAAGAGLTLRLSGPDGALRVVLPPDLFAEARARAVWLD
ncbi:MAG: hypothetical protein AAF914_15365 [Pseudomonadota bacterium]